MLLKASEMKFYDFISFSIRLQFSEANIFLSYYSTDCIYINLELCLGAVLALKY